MCEYDSQLDSTYNFNGPLIAFKKSAVPHIEDNIGADDANLALTCIANGYRAVYASDAIAYELQPISFRAQYHQKVRRADGLVNSTRLFCTTYHEKRAVFWKQIFPFKKEDNKIKIDNNIMSLWGKILVACIPAAIIGILFDEVFERLFYNYVCVALALIIFGILFIIIENKNKGKKSKVNSLKELTYNTVLLIGIFQLIAAIFPGTSRSGATIVGALLLGVSRTVAAEFTFFLAIPVMFGASLLKLVKFSFAFTGIELTILLVGMLVAFITSMFIIKFLMSYIKKHDFKVFGWYRIVLGIIVLIYAFFQTL